MLSAGLGDVPTPQTLLENFPLLFRTASHLLFASHGAPLRRPLSYTWQVSSFGREQYMPVSSSLPSSTKNN
jgi:hypothetical protein